MGCWEKHFRLVSTKFCSTSNIRLSPCPDYRSLAHEGCGGEGLYPELLPRPLQQQQLCQQQQHYGPLHGHNHQQFPPLQPRLLSSPHRTQLKGVHYSSSQNPPEYNFGFLLVGESSRLPIGRRIIQASYWSANRPGFLSVNKESRPPHCEKSLSVLASCRNIPLSRIDNLAVDTGTFFPPTPCNSRKFTIVQLKVWQIFQASLIKKEN